MSVCTTCGKRIRRLGRKGELDHSDHDSGCPYYVASPQAVARAATQPAGMIGVQWSPQAQTVWFTQLEYQSAYKRAAVELDLPPLGPRGSKQNKKRIHLHEKVKARARQLLFMNRVLTSP